MTINQRARFRIRDATLAWHDRVDAIFSRSVLDDRTGYGRFLSAQAAAHLPVESALEAGGIESIATDWQSRKRSDLICADLEALGLPVPEPEAAPVFECAAAMLGALYVLEGSRLGGSVLKRGVPDDFPSAFLGGGKSAAWRDLVALLDARLVDDDDIEVAIAAAGDVFALFEQSGRRHIRDRLPEH
jgi:heme oxygenase